MLRFLGLPDPAEHAEVQGLQCASRRGMAAETRERLEAHYAEPNRRLEEYLGMGMGWPAGERDRAER